MSKNVCMFVWNHFTNDARVLRECTALSEDGYHVDLICIEDPNDKELPLFEQVNPKFTVNRVKRYPTTLIALQKVYKKILDNKFLLLISVIIWLYLLINVPVIIIGITVLVALLLKTKLKGIVIKGNIILRMLAKAYRSKYDIYHANDLNTLPQAYISSKWRLHRKKLIYDSHEVQTSRTGYNPKTIKFVESFFIKKINSMIVENDTRAAFNEKLYGFYPNVLHNYPFFNQSKDNDKIDIHTLLNLPAEEKILLYQGGIQVGRGLDKLIQAVPMFNEGTVVLIGDGKIKHYLEEMVSEMGLEEKVKFIPKVPLKDLPKYTRNAYLGFQVLNNICFNHYSASSNKLFEYMMAGVPVVACDFPEIKRVVEGDKTGICIDAHKPEEIAKAVNQLLLDRKLRDSLSENSIKASSKYNWENEKKLLLDVYKNC
ncbi:glycosyltransferase [Lysinibacillus halotolerans]|uniref:Glycosyltransferase n=1 Tax=Lysinibacillus halotolerans TaxID=1368476 RepID=A0A3M8HHF3_9BACI|nr:glycosyltransferase [Lysinibacillus halotolerans]RND01813.1 glycosyltransferase [Lysinibacillus halotolerans]